MKPLQLPANQPPGRFYQGGQQIADFRGLTSVEPNTPEDWVGSTTSVRGQAPQGMTRLPDGRLLDDAIKDNPLEWLGEDHISRYGNDPMLLVKLLDAGQRLPVHAHPDGEFANTHLAALHGKAEAWYILTPGTVHLSLTRDLTAAELRSFVDSQDISKLLGSMHEITVEPGDCIFVPHGVLHSIGADVFLAEVQEPEDLSILLEWDGFDLDGLADGHLGVGFDVALEAVESTARSAANVDGLIRRRVTSGNALCDEASPFFRLDRVGSDEHFPAGFSIVIAVDGPVELEMDSADSLSLPSGSTTLIPFAAQGFTVRGQALVARPPAP